MLQFCTVIGICTKITASGLKFYPGQLLVKSNYWSSRASRFRLRMMSFTSLKTSLNSRAEYENIELKKNSRTVFSAHFFTLLRYYSTQLYFPPNTGTWLSPAPCLYLKTSLFHIFSLFDYIFLLQKFMNFLQNIFKWQSGKYTNFCLK
jgi:hypothetical protein